MSLSRTLIWVAVAAMGLAASPAGAADGPYAFEGTWVRGERTCTSSSVRSRTYTSREVISPRGRCTIRRVVANGSTFELLEDCRHESRGSTVTETIRLLSPETMTLKRQLSRLKIARQVHYARCTASPTAAPNRPPRSPSPAPTPDGKPR